MKITKESIFLTFNLFFLTLPFVAFEWRFDGYELPKFIFIIFFSLVFAFYLIRINVFKIPNKYFFYFLTTFIISTIFSENYLYSFFGDYPRVNQNLILFLAILIISIVFINYLYKFDLFKTIFIQSLFLNLISLFEKNERTISTLGQPNFLGIILVIGIIYAFENIKKNKYYNFAILFFIVGVIKTASITSIICMLFYFSYKLIKDWKLYWKKILLILFTFLLLINFSGTTKNKIEDNLNLFLLGGNTKITDSILVRTFIWKDSINIIFSNPKFFLIGSGPETFSLFYEQFRSKSLNKTSEWDSLIDKTHNYFLEILIEQGFLGFLALLILLFNFYKSDNKNKIYISIILIYLFFNWANLFLQIIFMLTVASNNNELEIKNNFFIKINLIIFILVVLFSAKFFRYEEINELNYNFYQTKNPQVMLNGLEFYQRDKNQFILYSKYLKTLYPNNLKIWFEIYKYEKKNNLSEQDFTKKEIIKMREDLVEWNEAFR